MRIRTQLLLVAAAALLPVIIASALALNKIREDERKAALGALRETVRATTLIIDGEIKGSMSALKALGNSRNLQGGSLKAFHEQAAAFNQLPDVWTVLLNQKGEQLVNTVLPFGALPPPRSDRALAVERTARVLSAQQPLVTDMEIDPATGKMLTSVHVPAATADGRTYVISQSFTVDHWMKTTFQKSLPGDWLVAVIDRNGRFISRSQRSDELLGQSARLELVAAAAASSEGFIQHKTLEGVEVYDAFSHSPLTGWTIAVAAPVQSIDGAANRAVQFALGGMLAAIAVTVIVVISFGRRLLGALVDAGRSAAALGQGHLPSIRSTGVFEIDQLNCALIDAGTLLATEHRGRRVAETERERLLFKETLARENAQAENAAKDQFMATLGHELRNPLATIAGATLLLEKYGSGDANVVRYVEMIDRQNRHLGRIVNDLLDVSRLIAGKIALEPVPLDMADCVEKCVEALSVTKRADGHTLTVRASPAWFNGDAVRIDQIVNNLLTNALKFSAAGGEVRVTVSLEGDRVTVTVADKGAGIQTELLPRVFDPFVQGPPPVNRAPGGLGIGLALVKQLVRLHGGDVDVISAGSGQGSLFSFWVPSITTKPATAVAPQTLRRVRCKLVYIEDNPDARAMMSELLHLEGYEVVEVANGAGALAAVLAARPDLVLSDIGLPDISGYEVARRLRAHPLTQAVPIIALTGYGQGRDKHDAALAGFNRHFAKPVDPDDLFAAIEELVSMPAEPALTLL